MTSTPTSDTYAVLQDAYDLFNRELFDNTLPECLITLSNELKRARGFYRGEGMANEAGDAIALNPYTFYGRSDREIYSTLAHEMVHLWQHHFGVQKTRSHHNKEWGVKMDELGLTPTSTGKPGGKRTGRKVTHMIVDHGPFCKAELKFKGKITWRGKSQVSAGTGRGNKRVKHTCPNCDTNAYSKPGVALLCGNCYNEDGAIFEMEVV
jgi:hypothetical protein